MTIKPVTASKTGEKEGHGQEAQPNNVRPNHRNILVAKSTEGQSPQRRSDIFDDVTRHRRSPHKSSSSIRSKRDHHKRESREKHCPSPQYHQVHSPHASSSCVASKSPKHGHSTHTHINSGQVAQSSSANDMLNLLEDRETYSGYNSGDEHLVPKETLLTADEWKHRDEQFIKAMSERGFIIQEIAEDGACLFRAISLQIYGDQEMHEVIRQQTMDYIYQNREYFAHFVTEDINSYVKRKRNKESHGNHIEIQAMSEIYNRPVELYCYQTTPTNIFNSEQINNGCDPLRLSYQRGSHYNAIIDPYNASVGVGLGLAGYKPESQTREAIRLSEQLEIEQTMFEDKLKTTDWEATNEAIEEQIARESYLQWCRENMQRAKTTTTVTTCSSSTTSSSNSTTLSSTVTSASMKATYIDNCTDSNSKDSSQYHVADIIPTNINNDPIKLPPTADRMRNESDLAGPECYDSDDTDTSSSNTADLYKDNLQMGLLKKFKFAKRSSVTGNCSSSKRRHKRRHRDSNDGANCSCENPTTDPCVHKRIKQVKTGTSLQEQQLEKNQKKEQPPQQISFAYGEFPCTSRQAALPEKPVSSFYRSLLESSYAEDGIGQLSESEMIMKAIRLSRIDFFVNLNRKREQIVFDRNTPLGNNTAVQKLDKIVASGNKDSSDEDGGNEKTCKYDTTSNHLNDGGVLAPTFITTMYGDHDDDSDCPSP